MRKSLTKYMFKWKYVMNNTLYKLVLIPVLSLSTIPTYAAISGEIAVKLNVTTGCTVKNSTITGVTGDLNNFGTLDFGKTGSTWANRLSAEVVNASGGTAPSPIILNCTADTDPVNVRIDGGVRGNRTLASVTDPNITVLYKVYRDAARTNEYIKDVNQPYIATAGVDLPIPVYGAIASGSTTGSGDFTDTLIMTISF